MANRNPFRTAEAHPFVETAFNLGMLGLTKLEEKLDEPSHDRAYFHRISRRVCPVKEHLSEFCRCAFLLVVSVFLTFVKSINVFTLVVSGIEKFKFQFAVPKMSYLNGHS